MPNFCKIIWYFILIAFFFIMPAAAMASKTYKDADAVITMREGQPCFFYSQNTEIKKRPNSFDHLSVSKISEGVVWEIQIKSTVKKVLLKPNTPETCILYGVLPLGAENIKPAEPLLIDTPYTVSIGLSSSSNGLRFRSDFCLVRDEKGNTVVVNVELQNREFKCLKPGEAKDHWTDILFGK